MSEPKDNTIIFAKENDSDSDKEYEIIFSNDIVQTIKVSTFIMILPSMGKGTKKRDRLVEVSQQLLKYYSKFNLKTKKPPGRLSAEGFSMLSFLKHYEALAGIITTIIIRTRLSALLSIKFNTI